MSRSMAYRGRGCGGFSGGGGFGFAKQEPFVLFPVSFCCCSFGKFCINFGTLLGFRELEKDIYGLAVFLLSDFARFP